MILHCSQRLQIKHVRESFAVSVLLRKCPPFCSFSLHEKKRKGGVYSTVCPTPPAKDKSAIFMLNTSVLSPFVRARVPVCVCVCVCVCDVRVCECVRLTQVQKQHDNKNERPKTQYDSAFHEE